MTLADESSFVTRQDISEEKFHMSPKLIAKQQRKDKQLQTLLKSNPNYGFKTVEGQDIIHYRDKIYSTVGKALRGSVTT